MGAFFMLKRRIRMIMFGEKTKMEEFAEMLDQVEEILGNLRAECLFAARQYDEAMRQIEELEADRLYLGAGLNGRGEW